MIDRIKLVEKLKEISQDLTMFYGNKIKITIDVNSKVKSSIINIEIKDV